MLVVLVEGMRDSALKYTVIICKGGGREDKEGM